MGVPKFFRWAGDRYPAMVSGIITEKTPDQRRMEQENGSGMGSSHAPTTVPPIDNLYLDMNGIIHNCSHSNNQAINAAMTADEVLAKMTDFIDYLVSNIVNPQKLLYMAIDGVAPRAKLNQQRARRFRAAKNLEVSLQQLKESTGQVIGDAFDSNCITPGTDFMSKISLGMQRFVLERQRTALPGTVWAKIEVIFSGGEVPGEGEHKIMQYIRNEKAQHRMPPNTRHCIYGADADMIMLSLATHESHVVIIREILEFTKDGMKDNKPGSNANTPPVSGTPVPTNHEGGKDLKPVKDERKKMQYIRINILREYLYREFCDESVSGWDDHARDVERSTGRDRRREREIAEQAMADLSLAPPRPPTDHHARKHHEKADAAPLWDLERIIDDFVFLTFLIGNDFLPHLPGIDIGDDAFDVIFDAYKNTMDENHPSYIVEKAELVDLTRLQTIFEIIGTTESVIYTENQAKESARKKKMVRRDKMKQLQQGKTEHSAATPEKGHHRNKTEGRHHSDDDERDESAPHHGKKKVFDSHKKERQHNHDADMGIDSDNDETEKLSDEDLRRAYYARKLNLVVDDSSERFLLEENANKPRVSLDDFTHEYLLGLAWNLRYYSEGVASWAWFYPFHYGPFLEDMTNLSRFACRSHPYVKPVSEVPASSLALQWDQGEPLTPFEQLLACLPPRSANLLPEPYSFLMNDAASPILEYYPKDFRTDLNGKKQDYEAVVLLPFIDAALLKSAEADKIDFESLDEETLKRNKFGVGHVYKANEAETTFPAVIDHGVCFEPVLVQGSAHSLTFWPSLPEILSASRSLENREFFGRTVYVSGGGGGRGGGRGGRGGRGSRGGDKERRGSRGNSRSRSPEAFAMPGNVPPPQFHGHHQHGR